MQKHIQAWRLQRTVVTHKHWQDILYIRDSLHLKIELSSTNVTNCKIKEQYFCEFLFIEYGPECKEPGKSRDYRGTLAVTKTGKTCQAWTDDVPHQRDQEAKIPSNYPDASITEAQNYCRDPDDPSEGTWCYTMDPAKRWEYCQLPTCEDNGEIVTFIYIRLHIDV